MTTFQTVAKEFYNAFTTDNPRKVWRRKDDSPKWMRAALYAAHFDGRLPDDWIYAHCRTIVSELADREDPDDDTRHEICEGLVDIYTSALTAWLASHAGNLQLCTDAVIEGLVSADEDIVPRIRAGQYMALTYICGALCSAISAQADERDEETGRA